MDGAISFAEVIVNSSANVSLLSGAVVNATGNLILLAESNITTDIGRVPTDDDTTEDAAVAISVINGTSNVTVGAGASLTAGGFANLSANNLSTPNLMPTARWAYPMPAALPWPRPQLPAIPTCCRWQCVDRRNR